MSPLTKPQRWQTPELAFLSRKRYKIGGKCQLQSCRPLSFSTKKTRSNGQNAAPCPVPDTITTPEPVGWTWDRNKRYPSHGQLIVVYIRGHEGTATRQKSL
ncbi:hypothetical protein AVEN_220700-1 [Araneus ventricosus]|uniref:Uncharacterized protein n=1 Tax=Araneus ventricosus TaxID=182803 RepID=A0A4Y2SEA3_ARAVE|nr:hypothetical protein AVEN_66555-1 [Araneus ventricosus]GBN85913.1 hypothetical protein AVEN_71194-1 [Araneus ventricosus]GBN85916.1 hypothetical protein AVEN_82956-1 [Araneus ventricosus]GBN85919.1 hypothetical protein AVEN_220700-1 [Araneus ventricosus]